MTQPTPPPRSTPASSQDIVIGATVYGIDDARFGQVAGSYRNYLIVERGFFMPVDYYVPMAAVGRVDQDLVVLSVSRDVALTQGWERPPFTSETGQRGLRRPAAGRPAGPTTPDTGASRSRSASTGTNPAGWPANTPASGQHTLDAAPVGNPAASPPGGTHGATAATSPGEVAPTGSPGQPAVTPGAGPVAPSMAVPQFLPTAAPTTGVFADTYAIGTNTESYHALDDPALVSGRGAPGQTGMSPMAPEAGAEEPSRETATAGGGDAVSSSGNDPSSGTRDAPVTGSER